MTDFQVKKITISDFNQANMSQKNFVVIHVPLSPSESHRTSRIFPITHKGWIFVHLYQKPEVDYGFSLNLIIVPKSLGNLILPWPFY